MQCVRKRTFFLVSSLSKVIKRSDKWYETSRTISQVRKKPRYVKSRQDGRTFLTHERYIDIYVYTVELACAFIYCMFQSCRCSLRSNVSDLMARCIYHIRKLHSTDIKSYSYRETWHLIILFWIILQKQQKNTAGRDRLYLLMQITLTFEKLKLRNKKKKKAANWLHVKTITCLLYTSRCV